MTPRKIENSEADAAARLLARAFEHDPMVAHLLPNERTRLDALTRGFRLYLDRIYLPQGHCYAVDGLAGCALWLPPGGYPLSTWHTLRLLPALARVFGVTRTPRALRDIARMESIHSKDPHWYLAFVGVEPAMQRQGIGSALLASTLADCDRSGASAYLETSNERNLPLYIRHGFGTMNEIVIPRGPRVWGMWRPPRTRAL